MSGQKRVFTCGYSGKAPHDLLVIAEALDAVLWDIRISARSRRPEWSQKQLSALLGDRYRWVPAFDNVNYKGGPMTLADPAAGLDAFDAETRPVILVCVCKDARQCHRSEVGALLAAERGVIVTEIDWARQIETDRETDSVETDRQGDRPKQMPLEEPV